MSIGAGKKGETPQTGQLDALIKEFADVSRPAREELFGQVSEALTTGGVGARIPIISKSVEASKAATSQALKQIDESLARSGLATSPFGARVRAGEVSRGARATAAIPTNIAQQLISFAPNLVTGTGGQVLQGAGVAAQTAGASQAAAAANELAFLNALVGAGGTIGAGKAIAACWIAAVLYGEGSVEFLFARHWIFVEWQGPVAAIARWIYLCVGQRLAPAVAKSNLLKALFRPLFDRAVARGRQAWHRKHYLAS